MVSVDSKIKKHSPIGTVTIPQLHEPCLIYEHGSAVQVHPSWLPGELESCGQQVCVGD